MTSGRAKKPGRRAKKTAGKNHERVAVVGLGYVGLPLAILAATKGYRVTGIDKSSARVRALQKGVNPLVNEERIRGGVERKIITATTKFDAIRTAAVIILCVPTPVDSLHQPDLRLLTSAVQSVSRYLRRDQLIILESTVNPGVSEEILLPILEKRGLRVGRDFDFAHCPERINPGDAIWHVGNIPRCLAATSVAGARRAAKFYRTILDAEVTVMKSLKEAEATKIVENSFRDVNIAFVNELARSFDALGIDLDTVLKGAATKPFGYLPHWPSIGVGGHCIPVDPYYLIERASKAGFDHKFLRLAREINNGMPAYAVAQLQALLNQKRLALAGTAVGVLGLSYKANVGDLRESPALKVITLLKNLGAKVTIYDPYFPQESTVVDLATALKKSTAIVLATNHQEFINLKPAQLRRAGVRFVVDGKNAWSKESLQAAGILYKGIGR